MRRVVDSLVVALWLACCASAVVAADVSHQGASVTWAVVAAVFGVNAVVLFVATGGDS